MERLRLTVLRGPLTAALIDGSVDEPSLDVVVADSVDAGTRAVLDGESDAAEASFAAYLRAREDGADVIALPLFTSRRFLQPGLLVRRGEAIDPRDLRGRRIGAPQYWMTASVWHRHLFSSELDLRPGDVTWVLAGEERLASLRMPDGVRAERVRDGRTIGQILLDGEVDAIVLPNPNGRDAPRPDDVASPYPDVVAVQLDYFRRTTVFPVLHVVVARRAALSGGRSAETLVAAFSEAKRIADARDALPPPVPGAAPDVLGLDPYAYGFEPNELAVDTFLDAAVQQSLVSRRPTAREIFAGA